MENIGYNNGKCLCSMAIKTFNCDPSNTKLWNQPKLPEDCDATCWNIKNGLWLCGLEPQQHENNTLCNRQLTYFTVPPYNYNNSVFLESTKIWNLGDYNTRYYIPSSKLKN